MNDYYRRYAYMQKKTFKNFHNSGIIAFRHIKIIDFKNSFHRKSVITIVSL